MAKNSLFAILMRSPWWISVLIAAVLAALAFSLLPEKYRVVGAMSAFPFVVIAALSARRQWREPSAARVGQTLEAVGAMAWPGFADLLVQAFERDRFAVTRRSGGAAGDFELSRDGRRMLVSAKRWKSARIGLEPLKALQSERMGEDISDALFVGLGELSNAARSFAAENRIAIWQGTELAKALQQLPLPPAKAR
jgi:restriction system protein